MHVTSKSAPGWLAQRFSPQVSEPVRLHVPAKRYLLATDSRLLFEPELRFGHYPEIAGWPDVRPSK